MPSYSSLRAVGLFVIAAMLSGCSFLSWPFPRAVENMEGLGAGRIADYIRNGTASRGDAYLKADITRFISNSMPAKGFSREDAEALGLQCAPAPHTDCTYSGEFWFLKPSDVSDRGPKVIENIQVRLSYLKPREFVVEVHERVIPEQ